ncbi:RNase H domain-containing protein [Trichonephila clavipes]|nr:RNase H domain-containing protein [Trichonephila clavipes]
MSRLGAQGEQLRTKTLPKSMMCSRVTEGHKSFEMCTNCSSEPATPAHIFECLGLTKQDFADNRLTVLDFLKVYDVIDLV